MKHSLLALICGAIFGFGLALSEMVNPRRVIGFLDIFGVWDPTLAFVMGGGLLVTVPAFWLVLRRPGPLLGGAFSMPSRSDIDAKLVAGSALFGIGWGVAGLCPGPAIAGLATGMPSMMAFVAVMWLSWKLTDRLLA